MPAAGGESCSGAFCACSYRRTDGHPGSSPGQAFAGTCAKTTTRTGVTCPRDFHGTFTAGVPPGKNSVRRTSARSAAAEAAATTGTPTAETAAATEAGAGARPATAARTRTGRRRLGLAGEQALALGAFAGQFAGPADRFRLFPRLLGGGLFVMSAELHLAEDALALHLLLQRLESLVDVVVADENLHACSSRSNRSNAVGPEPGV